MKRSNLCIFLRLSLQSYDNSIIFNSWFSMFSRCTCRPKFEKLPHSPKSDTSVHVYMRLFPSSRNINGNETNGRDRVVYLLEDHSINTRMATMGAQYIVLIVIALERQWSTIIPMSRLRLLSHRVLVGVVPVTLISLVVLHANTYAYMLITHLP